MDRNTWITYTQTGSGGSWEIDSWIYIPNESMELDKTSTLIQVQLATGANAWVSPEIKYNHEAITMSFLEILEGDTFKTTLEGYVTNQTLLKIIDHLGNEMIGIFSAVKRIWMSGEDDTYDIQATFTRML